MIKHISILIFILIGFVSCKSNKDVQGPSVKVPVTFKGDHRYSQDSLVRWQQFFKDKTLLAWLDSGLRNNQDTRQIFARIALANADLKVAKGNFLPQINLQSMAGRQRFGDYTVDGIGNFDTNLSDNITPDRRIPEHIPDFYVGLQTQWEADVWGKLRNRKKAAVARYLSSMQGWNDARILLMYHIAERYFLLQTFDFKLQVARENELLQERALELIKTQKEVGRATELAVKQFEAQTFNTKALEYELQRSIREIETEFNMLIGRMPGDIARSRIDSSQQVVQLNAILTPEQIIRARPDVLRAEWEMQAAGADVAAARAAFYPSLGLNANYGLHTLQRSVWFQFPVSLAYWAGGMVTAPLFQRNQLKAELTASKTRRSMAILEYEKSLVKAVGEVQLFLDTRSLVQNTSQLKEEEVKALSSGLLASRDLFVAGMATYLEVITAQKSVLQAQLDLADVKLLQLKNELNLYQSMGFGGLK